RTNDLIKVVAYQDDEFTIVGVEEGKGKLKGHVGAFVCETIEGQRFKAKLDGDTKLLKKYFENQKSCIGKLLTVKYRGMTTKNNVPRFPVGKAIRDKDY